MSTITYHDTRTITNLLKNPLIGITLKIINDKNDDESYYTPDVNYQKRNLSKDKFADCARQLYRYGLVKTDMVLSYDKSFRYSKYFVTNRGKTVLEKYFSYL